VWRFASRRTPKGSKAKRMIDTIFIAVIALFFIAGEFYARWCEKL
jgi:hypothetical protein